MTFSQKLFGILFSIIGGVFLILTIFWWKGLLPSEFYKAFLAAAFITTANFSLGIFFINISRNKPPNVLFRIVFGGMSLRLFFVLFLIFLSLKFLEFSDISFIFVIFFFYVLYLIIEIIYLNFDKNS